MDMGEAAEDYQERSQEWADMKLAHLNEKCLPICYYCADEADNAAH